MTSPPPGFAEAARDVLAWWDTAPGGAAERHRGSATFVLFDALRAALEAQPADAAHKEIRRLRDALASARWRLAKGRAMWNGPCFECDAALERGLTGKAVREFAGNNELSALEIVAPSVAGGAAPLSAAHMRLTRALAALSLEVPPLVARDFGSVVAAALTEAKRQGAEEMRMLLQRSTSAYILDHDTAADTGLVGIYFESPQAAEKFLAYITVRALPPDGGDRDDDA